MNRPFPDNDSQNQTPSILPIASKTVNHYFEIQIHIGRDLNK